MPKVIQSSLSGGEVSPEVAARTDIGKYKVSVETCENAFIQVQGGISNRPGLQFVAECVSGSLATRLIPFSFNTEQTYILEFGNLYMRVVKDGGQVLSGTAKTISGVTAANPGVVTATSHGFSNGDDVYVTGVVGMTQLNGRTMRVANKATHTFELNDYDGNNINTSAYTAYSSAGTAEDVFELTTTYATADLFDLRFVQSADTMTITHKTYPVREVTRTGHAAWTIANVTFAPGQAAPTSAAVASGGASTTIDYAVTAVNDETFEESLADTAQTTSSAATPDNDISWVLASGASVYNVYKKINGIFGFIGIANGTAFNDLNITPDPTDTPPTSRDPFSGTNLYPSSVGYFQQRRLFASSTTHLQRLWMTQTGNHNNMSVANPAKDDDAITVTIASLKVNEIRHLVQLGDLILLTSGGEWLVSGVDGVITPSGIQIKPQTYYGSTTLPPITAGDVVLFMQPGWTVRDLAYKFELDSYSGNDISILARHMFDNYSFPDWDYAQAPHSIIWAVRNDGIICAMTYVREQEVFAWSRHITKGNFKSVASVQEVDDDFMYVIVERKIGTRTRQYIERLHTHDITSIQDAFYVDSGLKRDAPVTITGYTVADPVVITAPSHGLSNADVIDIDLVYKVDTSHDRGFSRSTEVDGIGYTVSNKTTNTLELQLNGSDVDGSGFAAYDHGGEVRVATTTVSGLWHLEGETVVGTANGYATGELTVTNGAVTLPNASSRVAIGLSYTSEIKTLKIDNNNPLDSLQGREKKITRLTLRLLDTMGLWHGPDTDHMREAKFGLPALYGQELSMITGDKHVTVSPSWNKNGQIVIQQRDPLPMTLLGVVPDLIVGGN
jgi:hypothetical protein